MCKRAGWGDGSRRKLLITFRVPAGVRQGGLREGL